MKYWYVGSPYSNYPKGHDAAAEHVALSTAHLLKAGIHVFCPITHGHAMVQAGVLEAKDDPTWIFLDEPFVEQALGLIVITMEGWEVSNGLLYEIEIFTRAGKPILYMAPIHKDSDDDTARVR